MSDTTEAAIEQLRRDIPVMDAVCHHIKRLAEEEEAERLVRFSELLFSKASPEFLDGRHPDGLAHLALGAYRFLDRGDAAGVKVEVFNPDVNNEGWHAPVTVIRTNITERPFIVDTIREYLNSQQLSIETVVYPVLKVVRSADGSVESIHPSSEGDPRESLVHCEITVVSEEDDRERIRAELASRLQDVVRATDDFGAMLGALDDTVAELEQRKGSIPERVDDLEEIQAFLQWLKAEGFVFLGYRAYDIVDVPDQGVSVVVEPGSGLGILRNEADSSYAEAVAIESLPEHLQHRVLEGPTVIISKTNAESTIHRRARMDYIGVKKLGEDGSPIGEHRFVGLFTSKAFSDDAENIPILRKKLKWILDRAGVEKGSHDFKEINTIFNSMPTEELFLASAEELEGDVKTVLTTYHADEVRVTLRRDPLNRGVSIMAILPKDKFSGEVRRAVEDALVDQFEAKVLNYRLALGEGDQARLHFYLDVPRETGEGLDAEGVELIVHEIIRTWADRVREGLEKVRAPDEARKLFADYGEAFSPEYVAATDAETAVLDIVELRSMERDDTQVAIALTNPEGEGPDGERTTEMKLYFRGGRLILSDFMPILENMGLIVIGVTPFEVRAEEAKPAVIHSFAVQGQGGGLIDVDRGGVLLSDAILAVHSGRVTNDVLNELVLAAGLHWREVDLLRSYAAYAFQLGAVPSRSAIPNALRKHPNIANLLLETFKTKFDPSLDHTMPERKKRLKRAHDSFRSVLSKDVTALADDRALRHLWTLLEATVRTNYYCCGGTEPTKLSGGVPYLSLKFLSRSMQNVARTRLHYEVWVRSSRMEGVHLRGSTVARGGIRHSDRPDDFRTEILGLVNTQMVKNAVIVPGGSKGGFVTLRSGLSEEEAAEEPKEQYRTLMRGLLDMTDNLTESGLDSPEGVVSYDDPDPYLVVAADKGTAKFSDVANAVSDEYGFWLSDAFASGGSNGYDHKVVGITARGGWESVKRHFREMGKDIQSEPFTVVGIGDMSGDVFGNGMILSRQIRLIGAFDHRDIFIDPDPDPERSFVERQRLFDMGRSSWKDYDESLLSAGGMIIPRDSKDIVLSDEAREALGVEESEEVEELDGESLIRLILQAPVELLWNGGIGTYVKSSKETHADVGDASNDAVRVDSTVLRCKVVGEGGNLGLTQNARIEYALMGGRANTDALDNSGGVDLSDREVNLKILLGSAVQAGELSMDDRNQLLEELTDPVAELVLHDNESQSLAVSLDEMRARNRLDDFRDFMSEMERTGTLDRTAERLPVWETLVDRQEEGLGLTRPELSVLLSYAKLHLKSHVIQSKLPDNPALEEYLLHYFPEKAVQVAGPDHLAGHRLRRDIICSQMTNDLVDLMGATFIQRIVRDTGRMPEEIAWAWLIASRLAGHHALVRQLRNQESKLLVNSKVAYRWMMGLARVLERTTRWILRYFSIDESTVHIIEENLAGLASLRENFSSIVRGGEREIFETRVEELKRLGAAEELAERLMTLRFLDQLLEILQISREIDAPALDVAAFYYEVSHLFQVFRLRSAVLTTARDDRWEQRAAQLLAADMDQAHHRIVSVIAREGRGRAPDQAVAAFIRERSREYSRLEHLLSELDQDTDAGLAAYSVTIREIASFAREVART